MESPARETSQSYSDNEIKLSEKLEFLLADHFALYVKTLNCHWNIVDPGFYSLHKMFEEQYLDLANQNDLLAERIRQLDSKINASIREFSNKISIKEIGNNLTSDQMLDSLIVSYVKHIANIKSAINQSEAENDVVTLDLLTEIGRSLEKTLWMLKSHQ